MAWQNAFDLGSCTVTFNNWLPSFSQVWEGILGKGQSQSGNFGGNSYTISVDEEGSISLTLANTPDFSSTGLEILVTPNYAHDFPAQIVGLSSDLEGPNVATASGEINLVDDEGIGYLTYSISGTSGEPAIFSPDPLDMTALTGERDLIGVYIETQGI